MPIAWIARLQRGEEVETLQGHGDLHLLRLVTSDVNSWCTSHLVQLRDGSELRTSELKESTSLGTTGLQKAFLPRISAVESLNAPGSRKLSWSRAFAQLLPCPSRLLLDTFCRRKLSKAASSSSASLSCGCPNCHNLVIQSDV